MTTFFTIYVRPLLEYGSVVWSPTLLTNINKIENVQPYFTNKITGCRFRPYAERLKLLSLPTLQQRRLVADLTFLHHLTSAKISASLSRPSSGIYSTQYYAETSSKKNNYEIHKYNHNCITCSLHSATWNILPESVLSATNSNNLL